ncbi:MAG: hypothetical protein A2297_03630 [Elusimicrobia bacterium RIFOXYB2_FULL_48_7]|nr:MAG: hypothetical protein A2297_03630 [Elusimicrobia bacterium RIFOXYB2_FULL_48_7]
MKKIKLIAAFYAGISLLPGSPLFAQSNIDADDTNIQYVGRFNTANPKSPRFDWSGSYICAAFDGTSCSLRMQETTSNNYYNVFIDYTVFVDSVPDFILHTLSTQTVFPVASGLSNSSHTIMVTKRNEASGGICTFSGFVLDTGKTLLPCAPRPSRRLEFIGDSNTCGYGNETSSGTTGNPSDKENNFLSFGPIIARYYKADYHIVAWSGRGTVRNYSDTNTISTKTLVYYYESTVGRDEAKDYNFAWQPDAVFIFLGNNDYSTLPYPSQQQYEDGYYNFMKLIRSKYANAELFCVINSSVGHPSSQYSINVAARLNSEGDAKIRPADLRYQWTAIPADKASDGHPSLIGQQKIANQLIPIIASVMQGWVDTPPPSTGTVIPPVIPPVTPPADPPVKESVHAYPNPCGNVSAESPVRFLTNSSAEASVSIYTIGGRLVRRLSAVSGTGAGAYVAWDGKNFAGEQMRRGVYIYKVTGSSGATATGKMVLK